MASGRKARALYSPRPVLHYGNRLLGGVSLKFYTILGPGRADDTAIVEAALKAVAGITHSDEETGLGFVVLQLGEHANWLLIDRWVFGDSLKQANFRSDLTDPGHFRRVDDPELTACVWEAAVIDFERRAFIETMMTTEPNESRYLSTVLNGEV